MGAMGIFGVVFALALFACAIVIIYVLVKTYIWAG